MALQGTLDTFALPDVLRLLANTQKSGRILVQGDRGNGSLYLDAGSVVGGETSLATTDEGHEVLFELLRLGDGSFLFDPADVSDSPGAPATVEDVITAAEASHAEWLELSEVVPSLDVAISLAADLPDSTTTVDSDRWKLIVGIGSGTTVRALGDKLGLRELPVLRATRGLVDDGLAVIGGAEESASSLPVLDDDTDATDLFDDSSDDTSDLPEPLPGRSGASRRSKADPFVEATGRDDADSGEITITNMPPAEAAILEEQIEHLSADDRELIERIGDHPSPAEVDQLIEELPDGSIDRDLLKKFLGSVRA